MTRAAPTAESAVCADGTRVTNGACCAFIPVCTIIYFLPRMHADAACSLLRTCRTTSSRAIAVKMVSPLVSLPCCSAHTSLAAHEVIRLTFRQYTTDFNAMHKSGLTQPNFRRRHLDFSEPGSQSVGLSPIQCWMTYSETYIAVLVVVAEPTVLCFFSPRSNLTSRPTTELTTP